jgi:hypothetical protein
MGRVGIEPTTWGLKVWRERGTQAGCGRTRVRCRRVGMRELCPGAPPMTRLSLPPLHVVGVVGEAPAKGAGLVSGLLVC